MKQFFLFHIFVFLICTSLYIGSFHLPLFLHTVLFYRGIVLLSLVTFLLGCFLLFLKRGPFGTYFTGRDIALAVVTVFCINLVIFTHLPVTADRSVTVFLLGQMRNTTHVYSPEQLNNALKDVYLGSNAAIAKRTEEQVQTGTIVKKDEGYVLTGRGKWLLSFYSFIAGLYGVSKKNLSL